MPASAFCPVTQILAWVWAPAALVLICLGVGLVLERVSGADIPGPLLAPAGLGGVVVEATLLQRAHLSDVVTPVLVGTAILGLVLGRHRLRRPWPWADIATSGLVYAVYMAPVVLSGAAVWAGYNFVNDTASNFILADWLEHHGVDAPPPNSGTTVNAANLLNSGYPLGAFSLLAGLRPLTGVPLEAVYQPVMATAAGLTASSLLFVGRRCNLSPWAARVAAALPLGGVLLYRYVLHGAIKEILLVTMLVTAVGLTALVIDRRLALRSVVPLVVTGLAMILVFSFAAGAFLAALAVVAVAVLRLSPDFPGWKAVARLTAIAIAAVAIVLSPVAGRTLDFVSVLDQVFSASDGLSQGMLGQLLRPLPIAEVAGVWLGRDYRVPSEGFPGLNEVLVGAVVVTALGGIVVAVRRRAFVALMLVMATALPAAALAPMTSPYIDGKLMVLVTPVVIWLAVFGAATGLQSAHLRWRVAGAVALLAVAAGIAGSTLYAYRDARVAPADRIAAMKDVAAHVPGGGLYLLNEWEEYGKFFMRSARVNPASEVESPRLLRLRVDRGLPPDLPRRSPLREPRFGRWFDLDEQTPPFLGRFAGIIKRTSPAASRPPASYRLAYRNRFYELWRRDRPVKVRGHLPLQDSDRATAIPDCTRVRRLARLARPGDRMVAVRPPRVARLSPLTVPRPRSWPPAEEPSGPLGSVVPIGPGQVRGVLTAAGRQRVWLKATGGRAIAVSVDGRRVGQFRSIETPGQWEQVGTVELPERRAPHTIELVRSRATLRPNDSQRGFIGPVALQTGGAEQLVSVPPRRAESLCGRAWDWIELVGSRR